MTNPSDPPIVSMLKLCREARACWDGGNLAQGALSLCHAHKWFGFACAEKLAPWETEMGRYRRTKRAAAVLSDVAAMISGRLHAMAIIRAAVKGALAETSKPAPVRPC